MHGARQGEQEKKGPAKRLALRSKGEKPRVRRSVPVCKGMMGNDGRDKLDSAPTSVWFKVKLLGGKKRGGLSSRTCRQGLISSREGNPALVSILSWGDDQGGR